MAFWQNWFCRRLDGIHEPMVSSAALGWPEPTPGGWEDLKAHFLVGLERVAAHGASRLALDQPIAPAIEFPPLMHYTTRDALVHVAHHNAYHLGPDRLAPPGTWGCGRRRAAAGPGESSSRTSSRATRIQVRSPIHDPGHG